MKRKLVNGIRRCPIIDMAKTGKNLKDLMRQKGYTVKELQEYLELSTPQSIYHWFDGRNLPTLDNLYALSELFEVTLDDLVYGNRRYRRRKETLIFNVRVLGYYMRMAA